MKKIFFLMFAISILFCFSVTGYAVEHSHDNLTVMNVDIKGVTPEVYNFFERWSKAPNNKRMLTMACNYPFDSSTNMTPVFYLIDEPVPNTIDISLASNAFNTPMILKNLISGFSVEMVSGANNYTHTQMGSNTTFPFTVPSIRTVGIRDTKKSTISFSTYFASISAPISTTGNDVSYDWLSDTPLTVNFFSGSTPIFKEPIVPPSSSSEPPPPSSSSEPTTPPVFPPIEIPGGPSELPPINIPEVDRPVIVPPYDDEYIWYDPSSWEDFFNDIRLTIGRVINVAIILLSIILCIILILKIIKYFVRGDDIFKDWQL